MVAAMFLLRRSTNIAVPLSPFAIRRVSKVSGVSAGLAGLAVLEAQQGSTEKSDEFAVR
jgi:hypothetical protein